MVLQVIDDTFVNTRFFFNINSCVTRDNRIYRIFLKGIKRDFYCDCQGSLLKRKLMNK